MKKVLLGCGILVLVLGIAGSIGAYYFVWRPAKAVAGEFAKLKEIPKLNQQVRNTATFAPPSDNVLSSQIFERYLQTQRTIQTTLGKRADELNAKYQLMERSRGSGTTPTWAELTAAYKDFAGLLVEAKRAQVDALNQNGFSLAEYEWTRQRVYEAAGLPVDLNFEKIIREIAEGTLSGAKREPAPKPSDPAPVPEVNRTLVAPHIKELTDRAVLAAFGM
jgi:hypothetical protein